MLTFIPFSEKIKKNLKSHSQGFHDFHTVFLSEEHLDDPIIGTHESIHDRFLTTTKFGAVQRMTSIYDFTSCDEIVKTHIDGFISSLFFESHRQHEIAATYLSIKNFPDEKCNLLYELLDKEYRSYFDELSIVNTVFKSTFIQYIVADILTRLCFSSNILERLSSATDLDDLCIKEIESPRIRWGLLCNCINNFSALTNILVKLEQFIAEFGHYFHLPLDFNLNQESCWRKLDHDVSLCFTEAVSSVVEDFVYCQMMSITGYKFSDVRDPKYMNVLCGDYIYKLDKISGGRWPAESFQEPVNEDTNDYLTQLAFRASLFLIKNVPWGDFTKIFNIPAFGGPLNVFAMGTPVFISSESDTTNLNLLKWTVFVPPDGTGRTKVMGISHKLLIESLRARKKLIESKHEYIKIEQIIIGTNLFDFSSLLQQLFSLLTYKKSDGITYYYKKFVWYMGGNFYLWYKFLKTNQCKYFAIGNTTQGCKVSWLTEEEYESFRGVGAVGMVMLVFRLRAFPEVIFCKFMPAYFFQLFFAGFLLKDIEAGNISTDGNEDFEEITETVNCALKWIRQRWDYF